MEKEESSLRRSPQFKEVTVLKDGARKGRNGVRMDPDFHFSGHLCGDVRGHSPFVEFATVF